MMIGFLAACSSGSASDSRRFQAMEAEQTPQLPGAQQTHFAATFGTPDASPMPSVTPHAGISDLALASSIDPDGSPGSTLQLVSASSNQTVYAVARIANIQPGQVVSAVWRDEDNNPISWVDQTPPPSAGSQWVSFAFQFGGAQRGVYSIAIVIGSDLLESVSFEIR
ncbi:MAG: hypothetical protein KF883_15770 [Thermomicrobiales bacterium]|nr:hypothetical protein [Thermomicrobiales bacterium]